MTRKRLGLELGPLKQIASGWPGLVLLLTPMVAAMIYAILGVGHCDLQGRLLVLLLISIPSALGVAFWMNWNPEHRFTARYFEWVEDAERGDPSACFELGKLYLEGGEGFARHEASASHWLMKAADLEHPEACRELAKLRYRGTGGLRDLEQALSGIRRAEALGDSEAKRLRLLWERGEDEPNKPSRPMPIPRSDEAETLQGPARLREIVRSYMPSWMITGALGLVVFISAMGLLAFVLAMALLMVLMSAVLSEDAPIWLGVLLGSILLMMGGLMFWLRSPRQNFKRKLRRLFTRAHAGEARAQRELAMFYLEGASGLGRDPSQALWWMRQCAGQGGAQDAYLLAQWIDQGIGQHRNRREALVWLQRAVDAGHGPARVLMDRWTVDV